ncbi:MAG: exostosin family protein [Patescibacteria group bacterium]
MTDPRKLVFFVSPAWRRAGFQHIPLLYPFWGNALDKERVPFQYALFERFGYDPAHYSITDREEEADLILMPYAHNLVLRFMPELLQECQAAAKRLHTLLLVDGVGDIEHPTPPDALVLRYGGYRFSHTPNEIIVPPYADDLLELYCGGQLRLRQWRDVPVVGFSGWASLTPLQEMKALLKELPDRLRGIFMSRYRAKQKGVFFRRKALSILRRSSKLMLHTMVRHSYSGHRDTMSSSADTLRREFVDNLLESDYGLDIRGDANASMRLFEILSLGRIPVVIDTERNFPLQEKLDYNSFALIVDFRELGKLGERIAAFHRSLTPEQFQSMQRRARDAFCNYLRTDALTPFLMEEVRKRAGL